MGTRQTEKPKNRTKPRRKKVSRTKSSTKTTKPRGKTVYTYAIVRNHPHCAPAFRTVIWSKYVALAQAKNALRSFFGIAPENLHKQTTVDLRCITYARTFVHQHSEYIAPVGMTDEQIEAAIKQDSAARRREEEEE